ncbi:polymer-forming cytoskeletal protein [Halorussus salinisoli]|uniref:polymer-forming cytoskeletal protein n=1 Tax=Halorussus salinisoli TaxID=2558242 RepID=UPI0010C1929A|nr:polymer-forming cytoskeletal protein [Halorussus salinisoli]
MDKRLVLAIAVVLLVAAVPAPVAADETRTGGTVVVEEGETVDDDLSAFGGTVVVRGTVNGDLDAFGGNVFVDGRVNGDLDAVAGNVRINGTVTGDVSAVGGNVLLAQGARVGGQLEAGAGNVVVNGEVGEDARVGAETIGLGSSAVVGGDFVYDGNLDRAEGARIDGEVRRESDLGVNVGFDGRLFPDWVGWVYGFLVNLVLGAIVLLVFPRFSANAAGRATESPLRSSGVGLLLFVGIPVLAVLLFVSLVGIPLGLLVVLLYPLLLWLGYVFGAFALGTWALGLADSDSRWLALLVGLFVVSVVGLVPIVGGLVQFLVLLLGLGAFALGVWHRYWGRRERRASDSTVETT